MNGFREFFSPVGGPGSGAACTGDDELRRLWASLIRVGAAHGLLLPDAEDLAQESILAGMQAFDPARGEFGPFCSGLETEVRHRLEVLVRC